FGRSQGFRGWAWGKDILDKRINATGSELEHWTHHDLRRTMATRMAEVLNIAPHVIEAVLSHSGHKAGVAGNLQSSNLRTAKTYRLRDMGRLPCYNSEWKAAGESRAAAQRINSGRPGARERS